MSRLRLVGVLLFAAACAMLIYSAFLRLADPRMFLEQWDPSRYAKYPEPEPLEPGSRARLDWLSDQLEWRKQSRWTLRHTLLCGLGAGVVGVGLIAASRRRGQEASPRITSQAQSV